MRAEYSKKIGRRKPDEGIYLRLNCDSLGGWNGIGQ